MAILDTTDELDTLAAFTLVNGFGQSIIQIVDEHTGVFGLEIAAVMGDDLAVFQRDDIAADGKVVVGHIIADAGRLERATAFVDFVQVIAEDGSIGHLAAWRETLGDGYQATTTAFARQTVHIFRTGVLQQGLIAEAGHFVVGHAVAQDDDVFHCSCGCFRCVAKYWQ